MDDMTTDRDSTLARMLTGVPEHSVSLMTRASGGRALRLDDFLFYAGRDWLIGVGYPVNRPPRPGDTEAFEAALSKAIQATGAVSCRIIAPELPERLRASETKRDEYYVLAADAPLPARLRRPVAKAREELTIEVGETFTPAHRRLWGEFLTTNTLPPNVQALYGLVEEMLAAPDCEIRLLNAYTPDGKLAACLVIDEFMPEFDTYVLGAHSKKNYAPHASDALFALMLERARTNHKRYAHLGLGVNKGIARFKAKWGGAPVIAYLQAEWKEKKRSAASINTILASMDASIDTSRSEWEQWEHDLAQRPYRMLWKLEKNGRVSWLGGTAHFFCKSFERAFKKLYKEIDTVLFEGHLDEGSFEQVALAGKTPPPPESCLYNLLTEEERKNLDRVVRGPEGAFWRFLNVEWPNKADVRWHLRRTQHWYAFFSLWSAFLERKGWRYSVDMEAWRLAHATGKRVLALEDVEEQLETLRAIPVERALNHMRSCLSWNSYIKANSKAFISGNLEDLAGTSTEFPTHTGYIIGNRDQRFRERMRPYLEAGNCLAFVGAAHLLNLRDMLAEDGFKVTHMPNYVR